ncbi:DUF2935 domain-containing protein [Petroclostridium sp. X23]|jgi:hypothetical protein|uniref:DUF2935 domain-containing protein n=1 Tax=Petroclostridium sp. X23 TaxID=3045146 RepID=UPI0024AD8832|nr:DUF2935 domain-containing protein [Petroclostridium sp. X23]WHH60040.1 DUF2935 domain-containing protein [Petroclostridium sp. X23]
MLDHKSEVLFWTGVMRDHAMFEINGLAPKEQAYIQYAMYYRDFFQRMMIELERAAEYKSFLPNLLQGLLCFIEYKRTILKGLLACQIQINLPPSLINHQINEALEFQVLLTMPQQCLCNMMNLAGYIKMWLADSIGHAAGIAAFLDPSEELLQEEALKFKMTFGKLQTKASEVEMMLDKTGSKDSSLRFLANETILWMNKFIDYLEKVHELRSNCEALGFGTLLPLIPDHFIREHRYFISKIKECIS